MGCLKKIFSPISHIIDAIPGGSFLAPIALTALGQPELAAGLSFANSEGNGDGFGKSLLGAGLSYGGSALGGSDTIFGDSLSGGIKSALGGIGDSISDGASSLYDGSDLQDAVGGVKDALDSTSSLGQNALSSAKDSLNNLYQGSGLQNVLGGANTTDAGLSTSGTAAAGGGGSSFATASNALNTSSPFSANLSSDDLPDPSSLGKASNIGSNNLGTATSIGGSSNAGTALNGINNTAGTAASLGGKVASSSLLSPLASLGIGSVTNDLSTNALLNANKKAQNLLAPYSSGFSFNPGDLTQDPGYQFDLQQGQQALARQQNASGGYFSGAALKGAQDYGTGLADNTYNAAYNRALQGFQTGLGGATDAAQLANNVGTIQSKGITNEGNLFSGSLAGPLGGSGITNTGSLTGGGGSNNALYALLAKALGSGGGNSLFG